MDYRSYYQNQSGSGYPVFQGVKYQRGYGLGNIFRGLVGEIDEEQDKQIDLSLIRAEPLQPITH